MRLDNFSYAYVYAAMQVCVDIPLRRAFTSCRVDQPLEFNIGLFFFSALSELVHTVQ